MNETDLIELIQTHLPEELTDEQIAEIRAKMADSPELQEALLEELLLEQGLAMQYAPPVTDFDEVISRIEALAASRKRKHWLAWTTALICTLALVTTAIMLVVMAGEKPQARQVASASQPKSQPAGKLAGASQTKPVGPLAAKPKPKPGLVAKKPVEPPPVQPAAKPLPTGPSMTWRDYALPQDGREDDAWREKIEQILRGRHGRKLQWDPHQKRYMLRGTFELTALPAEGRMIRLGVFRAQRAPLELWSGLEGVRIDLQDRGQPLTGNTLHRRRKGDKAEVTGTCDDGWAWRWYRNGTVDIRYQDGEILVCRGRIPVLRLPLTKPPTEVMAFRPFKPVRAGLLSIHKNPLTEVSALRPFKSVRAGLPMIPKYAPTEVMAFRPSRLVRAALPEMFSSTPTEVRQIKSLKSVHEAQFWINKLPEIDV